MDSPWTAVTCSPTSRCPRSRGAAPPAWGFARHTCAGKFSTWPRAGRVSIRSGSETRGPVTGWCSRTSCRMRRDGEMIRTQVNRKMPESKVHISDYTSVYNIFPPFNIFGKKISTYAVCPIYTIFCIHPLETLTTKSFQKILISSSRF